MSPKWKPESRILNNTLAVYCLLNQGTQTAQIVINKMNTCAFMDQMDLRMWALLKALLKIFRERNSLPNSGCCKSKRVSMVITFIRL